MIIEGNILDHSTGKVISNAGVQPVINGQPLGQPVIFPSGNFTIDVPEDATNENYIFSAPGFGSYSVASTEIIADIKNLQASGYDLSTYNIYLTPGNSFLVPAIAAGGLLLLLSKKKKSVGKLETKDVMPYLLIAGVVVGFGAIKKVLEKVGILNSPELTSVAAIENDPNSFWKPAFYKKFSSYPNGALTIDQANDLLNKITDSFGFFQWTPNVSQLQGVFSSLTSQSEVSWLAEIYNRNTGKDLLTFMDDPGVTSTGLSSTEIMSLHNMLSKLPTN